MHIFLMGCSAKAEFDFWMVVSVMVSASSHGLVLACGY